MYVITSHPRPYLSIYICVCVCVCVIQSAGDWVSETPWVRILLSAEEDNLSPFDSKIACLCQSIEINNKQICISPEPGANAKWQWGQVG